MKKTMAMFVLMTLMLCMACAQAENAPGSWLTSVLGDELSRELRMSFEKNEKDDAKSDGYIALLYIEGQIFEDDYDYDHIGTLNTIDELMEDEKNSALMLYMNTPGGSLYEADELYYKIMTYKKQTGRPVYAYMAQECCSAGVYIAMAADRIAASRMTLTGSVGVYMSTYSQAGLFEKLGIENEYVATGENKVAGYPKLTDEQRAIYQAIVDEGFAHFRDVIASSRALTQEQMQMFLDGRVLTAAQAKAMGLIDDVLYYDEFTDLIKELHDQAEIRDRTPEADYGMFGSGGADMLKWLLEVMPSGSAKGNSASDSGKKGGLMS